MEPVGLFLSTIETTSPWGGAEAHFLVSPAALDAPSRIPACCPCCGNAVRNYDAQEEQRRHLNALLSRAYLHAVVPQVPDPENRPGGDQVEVPWARPGNEFTQLFEALVVALFRKIPVRTAAALLGSSDGRLWRFVGREAGQEMPGLSVPGSPVLERRSGSKGRDFLNLFYDLDVTFEIPRRESAADRTSAEQLTVNKELARNLALVARESSKAFVLAAIATLVGSDVNYEHFRITKALNDALGKVSAEEGKLDPGKSRAPPLAL